VFCTASAYFGLGAYAYDIGREQALRLMYAIYLFDCDRSAGWDTGAGRWLQAET